MVDDSIDSVVDSNGRKYALGRLLGEGYQGRVFAVKGQKLAVKVLRDHSLTKQERLQRRLELVSRFGLDDIPIARPIALLRAPHLGYVMTMLAHMEPLRKLMYFGQEPDLLKWYQETGGLSRRLRVLARCADALAQLHAKGLVYGDLSPNNVLISASKTEEEVYLIDADNLIYQSPAPSTSIGTSHYMAPELARGGAGVSTLTDAFSFAVIAFQALTAVHPLIGDWVKQSAPDVEAKALAGEYPWVDHETDSRNRSSSGITDRDGVLSPRLEDLARRTFQNGLNRPLERPGIAEWAEVLHNASDRTITCPNCKQDYYANRKTCAWCNDRRPPLLQVKITLINPEEEKELSPEEKLELRKRLERRPVASVMLGTEKPVRLPGRIVTGRLNPRSNVPLLELSWDQDTRHICAQSLDDVEYRLTSARERPQGYVTGKPRSFGLDWHIHLGDMAKLHRVVSFSTVRDSE